MRFVECPSTGGPMRLPCLPIYARSRAVALVWLVLCPLNTGLVISPPAGPSPVRCAGFRNRGGLRENPVSLGLKYNEQREGEIRQLEARLKEKEDEVEKLRTEVATMRAKLEMDLGDDNRCSSSPPHSEFDKKEREREASWWNPAQVHKWIGSRPIGTIMTSFPEKNGTPRQGSVAPASKAVLKVQFGNNPHHSLEGLEDFSHVWLLFLFHDNGILTAPRAKVKPPRLLGATKGVFATRAPHR